MAAILNYDNGIIGIQRGNECLGCPVAPLEDGICKLLLLKAGAELCGKEIICKHPITTTLTDSVITINAEYAQQ